MATDATGTPTPRGIPKYNTAVDAPSGKGFNAAMDAIDSILNGFPTTPSGIATGEAMVWNGSTWARSSVTRLTTVRPQDLTQDGATTGQALVWNGSIWAPASSSGVVNRVTSAVEVTNSTTETSMWSYSVGANALGTDKMLRVTMLGDLLSNSGGGGDTWTLRLKFGGTTYIDSAYTLNSLGTARMPFVFDAYLMNLGATNSQAIWARMHHHRPGSGTPTAGIGGGASNGHDAGWTGGLTTMANKDTTSSQTFEFTVQPSAASTNNAFRIRCAITEII